MPKISRFSHFPHPIFHQGALDCGRNCCLDQCAGDLGMRDLLIQAGMTSAQFQARRKEQFESFVPNSYSTAPNETIFDAIRRCDLNGTKVVSCFLFFLPFQKFNHLSICISSILQFNPISIRLDKTRMETVSSLLHALPDLLKSSSICFWEGEFQTSIASV